MSSHSWLHSYFRDQYVKNSFSRCLRSRAWFKLSDIQRSDNIFRLGMTVVDLGSSPGGWSQYVAKKVGKFGRIFAFDILPMKPIIGVDFFQGDLGDYKFLNFIFNLFINQTVDVVISDMSPRITGISIVDVTKSIYLGGVAMKICQKILRAGGTFIVKIFQGDGCEEFVHDLCSLFIKVKIRKPVSSRMTSREVYVVAKEYIA